MRAIFLRLPDPLAEWIEQRAQQGERSRQWVIAALLAEAKAREERGLAPTQPPMPPLS